MLLKEVAKEVVVVHHVLNVVTMANSTGTELSIHFDEHYSDSPDDAGELLGSIAWQIAETYEEDAREVILTELLSTWHRDKMEFHEKRVDEIARQVEEVKVHLSKKAEAETA